MTDRHAGYIVVLDEVIREDDAENIINAIKMIKGVIEVEPVIDNSDIQMAKLHARNEIINKLFELFNK